jgi:WD40 repeat protein
MESAAEIRERELQEREFKVPELSLPGYARLRKAVEAVQKSFLKKLNARTLAILEHGAKRNSRFEDRAQFVNMVRPLLEVHAEADISADLIAWEAANRLFDDVDVHCAKVLPWVDFVEFVLCRSEYLRATATLGPIPLKSLCLPSQWKPCQKMQIHYPASLKCHFEQVLYLQETESLVVLEENMPSYHVHHAITGAKKRAVTAFHKHEVLGMCYLDEPYSWVCTCSLDPAVFEMLKKTVGHTDGYQQLFDQKDHPSMCFWDGMFAKIISWKLSFIVHTMCFAASRQLLFGADYFTGKIHGWKMPSPIDCRENASNDFPRSTQSHLKCYFEIDGYHQSSVMCMLWVQHMEVLLSGSRDTTIMVWDAITQDEARRLRGHARTVTCLAYSETARMAISGGFESKIIVWDINAGVKCGVLQGHSCGIASLAFLPNSADAVSLDLDGVLKFWTLPTMQCVQSLQVAEWACVGTGGGGDGYFHGRAITCLSADRVCVAGSAVAAFSRDPPDTGATADSPIAAVCFCARRQELYLPSRADVEAREGIKIGGYRVWDLSTCKVSAVYDGVLESTITCLAMDLAEKRLAIGGEGGELALLNVASAQEIARLQKHEVEVSQILCLEHAIITISIDKVLMVHDDTLRRARPHVIRRLDLSEVEGLPDMMISRLDASLLNRQIAAGTAEGHLIWFNIDSLREEGRIEGGGSKIMVHNATILALKFFAEPLMGTVDQDGKVMFWMMRPLPLFEVFAKSTITASAPDKSGSGLMGHSPDDTPPEQATTAVFTAEKGDESLLVGTDAGAVYRHCIKDVLASAAQRAKSHAKEPAGNGAAKTVVALPEKWMTKPSRAAPVELLVPLLAQGYRAIATVGQDIRIRILDHDTGEILTTLSQGGGQFQVPLDPSVPLDVLRQRVRAIERWIPPASSDDTDVPDAVAPPSLPRATPVLRKSASMPRMQPPASPVPHIRELPRKHVKDGPAPLASGAHRKQRFLPDAYRAADRLAASLAACGDTITANDFRLRRI